MMSSLLWKWIVQTVNVSFNGMLCVVYLEHTISLEDSTPGIIWSYSLTKSEVLCRPADSVLFGRGPNDLLLPILPYPYTHGKTGFASICTFISIHLYALHNFFKTFMDWYNIYNVCQFWFPHEWNKIFNTDSLFYLYESHNFASCLKIVF